MTQASILIKAIPFALSLSILSFSGCTHENFASKERKISDADDVKTVVVFRTRCSDVRGGCGEESSLDAIRGAIVEDLEFSGLRIIQEEELFQRARSRTEVSGGVALPILGPILAAGKLQNGSVFDDLPPAARTALLKQAGVDGIVESRLSLEEGHVATLNDHRDATLQIRMGLKADGSTTSVHRCTWTFAAGIPGGGGARSFSATTKPAVDCALNGVKN